MSDLPDYLDGLKKLAEEKLKMVLNVGEIKELREAMAHIPLSGGKRLRPIGAMLGAEAFGMEPEEVIPLATAVELIHCFTLVHDDIMDKDTLRRGVPTVHTIWDENTAINAGDALFALAFEQIPKLKIPPDRTVKILEEVAGSVRKIAEGQQLDMMFGKRENITFNEYLHMVELKTAYLFMASITGGAIAAGADDKKVKKVGEFARSLGVAFQIQDDLLDLLADEKKLGKDKYSDIREGKRSLPIIKALEMLPKVEREKLKTLFQKRDKNDDDVKNAAKIVLRSGAVEYCKRIMNEYYTTAEDLIKIFPTRKGREHLLELLNFLRIREL